MWFGLHFRSVVQPRLWTSRRGPRGRLPGARRARRCPNSLETSSARGRRRARAGGSAGTAAHMKAYIVFSSVVIRVTAPLESMARKLLKPMALLAMAPCRAHPGAAGNKVGRNVQEPARSTRRGAPDPGSLPMALL